MLESLDIIFNACLRKWFGKEIFLWDGETLLFQLSIVCWLVDIFYLLLFFVLYYLCIWFYANEDDEHRFYHSNTWHKKKQNAYIIKTIIIMMCVQQQALTRTTNSVSRTSVTNLHFSHSPHWISKDLHIWRVTSIHYTYVKSSPILICFEESTIYHRIVFLCREIAVFIRKEKESKSGARTTTSSEKLAKKIETFT